MTSSTPDALWSAPPLRLLRPAGVAWSGLDHGSLLIGCSLRVPVGARLLIVSEPEESASLLLRVLGGLSRPSAGRVEIAGLSDPSADGWGRRVAYVGPEPGLRAWMTPRETLRLAADLLNVPRPSVDRRVEELAERVGLTSGELDLSVSRGGPAVAQRTALAVALLPDPEVLLLDEPLRAVEPEERQRLLRLPDRRRTVVQASRYPASEAGLVTHVALLRRGRVAMLAPLDDLEAAGLPLSMSGIASLAELRAAARGGEPGHTAAATR